MAIPLSPLMRRPAEDDGAILETRSMIDTMVLRIAAYDIRVLPDAG